MDFWGELECAFLNPYEARWQYVVDSFGFGFAQGKTLFYRRSLVPGGVEALACEPAEDAATTKILRAAGLRIRLARPPFFQPLGRRTFAEVWSRQVRWARLRRVTFPLLFAPEILTSAFGPAALAAAAASALSWPVLPVFFGYLLVWCASELLLSAVCGWPLTWRSPLAIVARDALIPILWGTAFAGRGFVWKGQPLQAGEHPAPGRPDPSIGERLDAFALAKSRFAKSRFAKSRFAKNRFAKRRVAKHPLVKRRSGVSRLAVSTYVGLFKRLPSADRARAKMASALRKLRKSD